MKEHRIVGALALALLAICVVGIATAGTLNGKVVHATQYEDGTAMPVTDITQTRYEYGSCSAPGVFGTKAGEFVTTGNGTTGSKSGVPAGTYCLRAYTTAKGVESVASNVTTSVIDQSPPKPPTLSAVAPQAYEVVPDVKHFAFNAGKQIGTVKLGAACDEDRTVGDGYYAIVQYRAAVTLWPGVKSQDAVLAKCGTRT